MMETHPDLLFFNDRLYWAVDELVEMALDEELIFPLTANRCRKCCGYVPSAADIAEEVFADYFLNDCFPYSAEWVSEWVSEQYLESLYFDCDEDPPTTPFLEMDYLQQAIDRFCKWNTPIYKLFGVSKNFNPRLDGLGFEFLEMALRHWGKVNKELFHLWTASREKIVVNYSDYA